MRRNAGSFVRKKFIRLSLWGMAGAGILIGLAIGLLFYSVKELLGTFWGIAAYTVTAAAVYVAVRILDRPSYRWNIENLRKGVVAETRVGQIIGDHRPKLRFAHSVTARESRYRSPRATPGG